MQCKICGQDNTPEARFCANCGAALVTAFEKPETAAPASLETPGEYAGFWIRLAAAIIDGVIIMAISFILALFNLGAMGSWILLSWSWILLSWLYYWLFTGLKGQTLGKMAVGIKVVDEHGNMPGLGVAAMREILGKTISAIVLYIGFLWIIWDKQKRGWHDKIANTYVVKVEPRKMEERGL